MTPPGVDTAFYVADKLGARRILDPGCGTGLLTWELARPDRDLLGIDPAPAMLTWAREQPGAERVR